MERVLFNAHSQVCTFALRRTSPRFRRLAEHSLLLVAVCGFGILIVSHVSFVHRASSPTSYRASRSIPRTCLRGIPGFQPEADVTHVLLSLNNDTFAYTVNPPNRVEQFLERELKSAHQVPAETCPVYLDVQDGQRSCTTEKNATVFLSYSRSKGFLLLTPEECLQHGVSTQFVRVGMADAHCFGEPFLQAIVSFLGPDTVVLNWLVGLHDGKGYVYNPRTKNLLDLGDYARNHHTFWGRTLDNLGEESSGYGQQLFFKLGVVFTSLFLFFITTTLVSFTLRETQDRMLEFTFQLQAHVRARRPHAQLIVKHVAENLVFVPIMVGMMFFLIEFYGGDKFLAFMVLSIMWVCEVFSIISMRTTQGMIFFPKTFFLLFTLFHIYFFSCPFGFSYTALASTVCFMLHSMLFFWHRFELPAVAHGLVTLEAPRMEISATATNIQGNHVSNTRETNQLPVMPSDLNAGTDPPQLAPRTRGLVRQHSNERSYPSMSSLGRSSLAHPSSSVGLFHDGDDGDESYRFFLDGEVVIQHNLNGTLRSPSPSTQAASTTDQGHSEACGESETARNGIPQRILTTTTIVSAAGEDADTVSVGSADDTQLHRMRDMHTRTSVSSNQEDLTPRVDNVGIPDENHSTSVASALLFPRLDHVRR